MSKSALVKIGVSPEVAETTKRWRMARQIMDQRDAAVARLTASAEERLRELLNASAADDVDDVQEPAAAATV